MKSIISNEIKIEFSSNNEIYYKVKNNRPNAKYNHYKAVMRGEKISNRTMISKNLFDRIKSSLIKN